MLKVVFKLKLNNLKLLQSQTVYYFNSDAIDTDKGL